MGFGTSDENLYPEGQMISRPAIVPAVRLEHPQVRLPADSKGAPHAMHRLTLMAIGDNPARRRAIFFCSMSFTTLGGSVLIFKPSDVVSPPDSRLVEVSGEFPLEDTDSSQKMIVFPLNITLLQCPNHPSRGLHHHCKTRAQMNHRNEILQFRHIAKISASQEPDRCQSHTQGVV